MMRWKKRVEDDENEMKVIMWKIVNLLKICFFSCLKVDYCSGVIVKCKSKICRP